MKPAAERTHGAEGGVGDQVEVVDGGQEALQLFDDGAQPAYHVRQEGGHLEHEAHDALQLLRHHQLERIHTHTHTHPRRPKEKGLQTPVQAFVVNE